MDRWEAAGPWVRRGLFAAFLVALVLGGPPPVQVRPDLPVSRPSWALDGVGWLGVVTVSGWVVWALLGGFSWAGLSRRSVFPWLVLAVALAARFGVAVGSIAEIELQFASGTLLRHSTTWPLWQLAYQPWVPDHHQATFLINGLLGSLAVLPLYRFVLARTGDEAAAITTSMLAAVSPTLVRFSPSDGPYALMTFCWYAGLALLSQPVPQARATLGGLGLLAIAGTVRMEGVLYLGASLLLLDPREVWRRLRTTPAVCAFGLSLMVGAVAVQMTLLLPYHLSAGAAGSVLTEPLLSRLGALLLEAVWPAHTPSMWAVLIVVGAVAGLTGRWRLGLMAVVAAMLVQFPVARSRELPLAWHRLPSTAAMQVMAAGVGLALLIRPLAKGGWPALLLAAAVAAGSMGRSFAELRHEHLYNVEYRLARGLAAPGGVVQTDCTVLVPAVPGSGDVWGDSDLHRIEQVLPGAEVVRCHADAPEACAEALADDRCDLFIQLGWCFLHPDGVPPACRAATDEASIRAACTVPACASVQAAGGWVTLGETWADPTETFPLFNAYPTSVPIGVYRREGR